MLAKCTVLWDYGVPNVILSVDMPTVGDHVRQEVRDEVTKLGVTDSDFALATSYRTAPTQPPLITGSIRGGVHGHHARRTESAKEGVVLVVGRALEAERTECWLEYLTVFGSFSDANRAGDPGRRAVPIMVARTDDGHPHVVLFGYGQPTISSDSGSRQVINYPNDARTYLENAWPGLFAQFIPEMTGGAVARERAPRELGGHLGATVSGTITSRGRRINGPILTTLDCTVAADWLDQPPTSIRDLPWIQVWRFSSDSELSLLFCGGRLDPEVMSAISSRNGGVRHLWMSSYDDA